MVTVPARYDPLVREMASGTGIPYSVIAAQANTESGFNATAKSSAGALGWLQFEPSTYSTYAAQAGVGDNTEFNPADEAKVYIVYMRQLLKQEHGNLRDALAAYNAGPGNLQAGYGYADQILGTAGEKGGSSTIGTTGAPGGLLGGLLGGLGAGGISISGVLGNALGDLRDVFERLGLILFGAALILLGIHMLASGGGGSGGNAAPAPVTTSDDSSDEPAEKPSRPTGTKADASGTSPEFRRQFLSKTGASEAAEAAAVA